MKKQYFVQVNDYMTPVQVMLTEEEANTVAYVLEEIAKGDKDALVGIIDSEDGNELYGNYEDWIKTYKKLGEEIMTKTININVIKEKELINKNGKVFHIIEVNPEIIFIIDENNNFITHYCGSIDEDEDNLKFINQR